MSNVEHSEDVVILEEAPEPERTPDWAPKFRTLCQHLRDEGHLEAIEELAQPQRRADATRLIDVVLFLIGYICAPWSEGGLRGFWNGVKKDKEEMGAMAGRTELPSSTSISRFFKAVEFEHVEAFRRWAFGEATDLEGLVGRSEVKWLDTEGDGWDVVDWDPTARVIRQRTLIEGEDYPEAERYGPKFGEHGQIGRKRGELKFVRGLMGHAGTGQWLGAYRQEGNGTLIEEIEEVKAVREALEGQRGEGSEARRPVMRIDGEGGEVPVINAVREAGFCPLVRLKQYQLLERTDVREAIEEGEGRLAEGTGTGPKRETFEVGRVPLTSHREVEELHRWDEPLEIRLVVSRYEQTEADEGPGKLIDGMRYEMFGTGLGAGRWPAKELVDAYFGRSTVENRIAGTNREVGLGKEFSREYPAGQHLAEVVGLWVWNLMIEKGDELVDDEEIPANPKRRGDEEREASGGDEGEASSRDESKAEPSGAEESEGSSREESEEGESQAGESTEEAGADEEGRAPIIETDTADGQAQLSETTKQRLREMEMTYREAEGVLECAEGYILVPKKSGDRDETHTTFRVLGLPCRGCDRRDGKCTNSSNPAFRKEAAIANEEVPGAAAMRDADRRGGPVGVERSEEIRAGPKRVRRPGFQPAKRRKALREAAREAVIRVGLEGAHRETVAEEAREYTRKERTRQRLPDTMRRRYRRLPPEAEVTIIWDRGKELAQIAG